MFSRSVRFASLAVVLLCGAARAQFVNGSFESGDFTGWITQDVADPTAALDVVTAGADTGFGSFETTPTDGSYFALTGFDGAGPGTIFLAQDVTVPADGSTLMFDYRAGWDLETLEPEDDRSFSMLIEPALGGSPLQTTVLRSALAGTTVDDTGLTTASVNLSEFAGQEIRVKFAWSVPEDMLGPGICQLDNVRFAVGKLPATDKTSLKLKLDFVHEESDSLGFSMIVPVSEGFEMLDEDVSIGIGDASFDFMLDAKGNAVEPDVGQKCTVRPAGPMACKVTLNLTHADLQSDLSDWGLENTATGPAGVFCALPVMVTLDGTDTARTLPVLYKAVEDVKGNAAGKLAGEKRAGKMTLRLDFADEGNDSLTLKGLGMVMAGFAPEGVTATVDLGSLSREFELDAAGKGTTEDMTLAIKRDKKNPGLYAITLACAAGELAETLEADGFTNETLPKPGVPVPVMLTITLDGRVMQTFLTAKWAATANVLGVANAKF